MKLLIELQQIQHLNNHHHHAFTSRNNDNDNSETNARFSFTWVLTTDVQNGRPGSVRHRLQQLQAQYKQQQQR